MPDLIPGFFGKLPSHGDFIDRGLDRSFIGCWDAWLARGLAASRQRLAPDWLALYMVAPIWRFVLGPGICGEGGWQGILMPSVDRVNRHFPLTVALPCPSAQAPLAALLDDDWFAHCEALALEALTTGLDADHLWRRLAGLRAPRTTAPGVPPVHARAWHFALPTPAAGAGLGWCLSEALLGQWTEPCSLWSSTGSDQVEPALLLQRGLPAAEAFTALLNGDFAGNGWHSCRATDAWRPLQSAFYPVTDSTANPVVDAAAHGADDAPADAPPGAATGSPQRATPQDASASDSASDPATGAGIAADHRAMAPAATTASPNAMPGVGPDPGVYPGAGPVANPDAFPDPSSGGGGSSSPADSAGQQAGTPASAPPVGTEPRSAPTTQPAAPIAPATTGAPARPGATALPAAPARTGPVGPDANEQPDGAPDA